MSLIFRKDCYFTNISAQEMIDAQMYINAVFKKGLEINPQGLSLALTDYVGVFCADMIVNNYDKENKKQIIKKAFTFGLYLGNTASICVYLAYLMLRAGKEKVLTNDIHLYIEVCEELAAKYIDNNLMLSSVEGLEMNYYEIHQNLRKNSFKYQKEFILHYEKIKSSLLALQLEWNLHDDHHKAKKPSKI